MPNTEFPPETQSQTISFLARVCLWSYRVPTRLYRAMNVGLNGFWLAVLEQEDLHALTSATYAKQSRWHIADYNRSGLWEWEKRAIDKYFDGRKRILIAAAGGGREVLALRKRGFVVDGFEAHPGLVRFANEFLEEEGFGDGIQLAPWDGCPEYEDIYDGVIIGWGAYMHIRGRENRVALLRAMRERVRGGSPILLSFSTMERVPRGVRTATWIANALRLPMRREKVELGDWLEPAFNHSFTEDGVREELKAAGFEMVCFGTYDSGHAVGIALE